MQLHLAVLRFAAAVAIVVAIATLSGRPQALYANSGDSCGDSDINHGCMECDHGCTFANYSKCNGSGCWTCVSSPNDHCQHDIMNEQDWKPEN
jgi:hypothetical protein